MNVDVIVCDVVQGKNNCAGSDIFAVFANNFSARDEISRPMYIQLQ